MKMIRLIYVALAACWLSGAPAQAQVQERIQINPDLLTKRPALVPQLKLKVLDLPDLAITELRGPDTGPDEAGELELIINLQNSGGAPISLNFLDEEGQVQPTFEVVYLAPGQSLLGYLSGTATGDETPIVKRVFLDAVLEPGQKLSHIQARSDQAANLISISLPGFRDESTFATGVHRLVVVLDPAETVIERSRRNNIADFTWVEETQAVSVQEQRGLLELTIPTTKPVKQKTPELRPFE